MPFVPMMPSSGSETVYSADAGSPTPGSEPITSISQYSGRRTLDQRTQTHGHIYVWLRTRDDQNPRIWKEARAHLGAREVNQPDRRWGWRLQVNFGLHAFF